MKNSTGWQCLICLVIVLATPPSAIALDRNDELKADDVAEFYISPGAHSAVHFLYGGTNQALTYQVQDYQGHNIRKGLLRFDAQQRGIFSLQLKRGYYELVFPQRTEKFGIVCLEPIIKKDPFFGCDIALSWLELRPVIRKALIRIMDRSGIAMSRERLGVGGVNPEPGKWDWTGGKREYESLRNQYRNVSLPVLDILTGSSKAFGDGKHFFPQQLIDYSETTGNLGEHWQHAWGGVEVMNEPDLGPDSGEEYAGVLKAASYGLHSKSPQVPVVGCVAATQPPSGWFDTLAANGALLDLDAVSFHSYDPPTATEKYVQRFRDWLAAAGQPSIPLWHTECGWRWKAGSSRPTIEEDTHGAAIISANAVEDFACGIARFFPFVLVPYAEGTDEFGLLGREMSPTRRFAAYLATIHQLSGKSYLGDVVGLNDSISLARAFGDGKTDEVVVFLHTGDPQKNISIEFPARVKNVTGIDGREISHRGRHIEIEDGMIFVRTTKSALGKNLKSDTSTAKLFALGYNPVPAKRLASPVVLQFLPEQTPARDSVIRYTVSQEAARNLPITVRFNNLSGSTIQMTPALEAPEIEPLAQSARSIPPRSSCDVTWHFDARQSLDLEATHFVVVSAKTDQNHQPSPLAIPIAVEGTLKEHLARHSSSRALTLTNLAVWRDNSAGEKRTRFSVGNGIFSMSVTGPGWAYPKLAMDALPLTTQDRGFLIRARILSPARHIALIVNNNRPDGFWDRDIFKGDGQWHVVYIPFDEMKPGPGGGNANAPRNPAAWNILSLGANFENGTNVMEISDVYIVGNGLGGQP